MIVMLWMMILRERIQMRMNIRHESGDILKEFIFVVGIRELDMSMAKQESRYRHQRRLEVPA